MEERLQPVLELGEEGALGNDLPRAPVRSRRDRFHRRRLRCPRTPRCVGRKRGVLRNALGRSRGGFTTKLHAVVDTKARPIHIALTPGQRHELIAADELLAHARGKALLGDTSYDSNAFLAAVRARGMRPIIPSKPERPVKYCLPRLYKKRYLVEIFFHNLKRFRAVATRYDKTARNYLALVQVACAVLWLN